MPVNAVNPMPRVCSVHVCTTPALSASYLRHVSHTALWSSISHGSVTYQALRHPYSTHMVRGRYPIVTVYGYFYFLSCTYSTTGSHQLMLCGLTAVSQVPPCISSLLIPAVFLLFQDWPIQASSTIINQDPPARCENYVRN